MLHDVCESLDDPTVGHDGHFLSAIELQEKKDRENVVVLKNDPPSVPCKLLFKMTPNPSVDEMRQVAVTAFGDVSKLSDVSKWFAYRRSSQFAKAEERLKRRCGEVTASVSADVEHLPRQTRGLFGMNGQCAVTHLRLLLGHHGLVISGTKVELMQRVHNHIDRIRESHWLQSDKAIDVEEHVGGGCGGE